MKRSAAITRLLALSLVLVMALSLTVPAMAADECQVRIHPNRFTSIPSDAGDSGRIGRFKAYQVFEGVIQIYDNGLNPTPNVTPMANEMSGAKWGDGISNVDGLLSALKGSATPARQVGVTAELMLKTGLTYEGLDALAAYAAAYNDPDNWEPADNSAGAQSSDVGGTLTAEGEKKLLGLLETALGKITLGDLFTAAVEAAEGNADSSADPAPEINTAAAIASVLSDFTEAYSDNTALAEAFAKIVGKQRADNSYLYLDESAAITSGWSGKYDMTGCWTVDDAASGYYLIVDTYTPTSAEAETGKVSSDYILGVFGSQDIYVKSYAPTVNKVIVDGDSGNAQGDDFELGEEITFRITGTLPENLDNYTTYAYTFTDTMADGLTYVADSMQVYAVEPAPKSGIYLLNQATAAPTVAGADIVSFADLFQVVSGTKVAAIGATTGTPDVPFTMTADWQIVVQYKAVLNMKAKLDSVKSVNKNSVILTYSNDILNADSKGKTTASTVYLYDFGVELLAFDGVEGDGATMEGVGFTLTKQGDDGETLYALFEEVGGTCYLSRWITETELLDYLEVDSADKIDWAALQESGIQLDGWDSAKSVVLSTDGDGKLRMEGLKAETYTLSEVVIPKELGLYEDFEPIILAFTAEYYTDADTGHTPGTLKNLYYTEDGTKRDIVTEGVFEAGHDELVAQLDIPNMPARFLPGTGGMGTVMFYLSGTALLLGAALILLCVHARKRTQTIGD